MTGWMGRGNPDYYTAQYRATDGFLLWEARFDGSDRDHPTLGDWPNNVAMDAVGSVFVTGYSSNRTNTDFLTIKYTVVEQPAVTLQVLGEIGTRISFTGTPGLSYSVQHSSPAAGPFSSIGAASVNTNRVAEFIDPTPPGATAFYRVSYP